MQHSVSGQQDYTTLQSQGVMQVLAEPELVLAVALSMAIHGLSWYNIPRQKGSPLGKQELLCLYNSLDVANNTGGI